MQQGCEEVVMLDSFVRQIIKNPKANFGFFIMIILQEVILQDLREVL